MCVGVCVCVCVCVCVYMCVLPTTHSVECEGPEGGGVRPAVGRVPVVWIVLRLVSGSRVLHSAMQPRRLLFFLNIVVHFLLLVHHQVYVVPFTRDATPRLRRSDNRRLAPNDEIQLSYLLAFLQEAF